ncbi:MAG: Na+/H+ antiporter NhaA [Mucinivorans sp.]
MIKFKIKHISKKIQLALRSPLAGGVMLISCTIIALVLSNIEATAAWYQSLWSTNFTIGFEGFALNKPFELWVNDALMAVFFFVVGLEIKREIVAGELRSPRQAMLPIAAAVGGMIVPALIYTAFNFSTPSAAGWGIPMATDIAFALGVVTMLGKRVPLSLKIFLTALAIVDDLGAILVIAIFYSTQIDWIALVAAGVVFALLVTLNKAGVYRMRWYLVPAVVLWLLFLRSGIHATIAGVLIAFAMPASSKFSKERFTVHARRLIAQFGATDRVRTEILSNAPQHMVVQNLRRLSRDTISPVQRLEYALQPTVAFFIMPLFALSNAGVIFSTEALSSLHGSESLGIFAGLVLGKPLGIMLFSFLVIHFGLASMPAKATWRTLMGVSSLGGIGFTMSIFIDHLAFTDPAMVAVGKIAILMASVTAGVLGSFILFRVTRFGSSDRG